jgi:hypothetical protein
VSFLIAPAAKNSVLTLRGQFQSVQEDMLFASASISFLVYSVIFVAATAVAAVFIVPLMAMSFFFSGLVLVFSSLSYATFRMASSKYNHTVLFLNRLLRRLADNIPPSVGLVEIGAADKKELNLKESVKSLLSKLKRAEVRAEVRAPGATVDVQGLDSNAPVIVDEELTAATGATTIPDEQEFEDVPIQPLQNGAGPEPDTVKDGALNP